MTDPREVLERMAIEVWVPSHWLNTLMANPNWIVGMTLEPDDTGEWVQVTILTDPADAILGKGSDE